MTVAAREWDFYNRGVIDDYTAVPYSGAMQIIHTRGYLRAIKKLFSKSEAHAVDDAIAADPEAGAVIAGTHGVRKLRVAMQGRGKRGGARVVYYYWREGESAFLLYAYAKNTQEDLLPEEKKQVAQLALLIQRGGYEN